MTVEASPLCWPIGWPRTKARDRRDGRFSKKVRRYSSMPGGSSWTQGQAVTVAEAINRIIKELSAFGVIAVNVVISTNLALRNDGLPRSGQRAPDDPGVAVYFQRPGEPQRCIPCDQYTDIAQNLAAVAATIAALRALERHGSGIMERAFTGFEALPHLAEDPWYVTLGVGEDAPPGEIEAAYQRARSKAHPDRGGTPEQFDRVQRAYQFAIERG